MPAKDNSVSQPVHIRPNRVAVIDFGGQYVDLVVKACQRQGFLTDLVPSTTSYAKLKDVYGAIVLSGSPANSSGDEQAPMPDASILSQNSIPILGICYGHQILARHFGGTVLRGAVREDKRAPTNLTITHPLFYDVKENPTVLFTHGDFVADLPSDVAVIGQHTIRANNKDMHVYSAIAKDNMVGVQFHPEVFDDTPEGYQIFHNFLVGIAGLSPDLGYIERLNKQTIGRKRKQIRKAVGTRPVIAFVSGGVDSSVMIALAKTAIPASQLHALYIDNGLMRAEDDAVIDVLKHTGVPVQKYDASKQFMTALKGVSDPETKRKVIGRQFVTVQDQIIHDLRLPEAMLLQGTNAADRIESGNSTASQHTATIKTHHNQVSEIQELKRHGLLLEPLDDLFKDEIRSVGISLGLPDLVVSRHPFPGPGLGIRVLCTDSCLDRTPASTATINQIQAFCREQTSNEKLAAKLLPVLSVGVAGDERTHLPILAVQGVTDWKEARILAEHTPSHFRGKLNRVVVALGPQGINDLNIVPTTLTTKVLGQLRAADAIIFETMRKFGVLPAIKQCPVVLLPLGFGADKTARSIVLRPVATSTFMTVKAMLPVLDLPEVFIKESAHRILNEVPGISQVFIDATNKPPATTEYE